MMGKVSHCPDIQDLERFLIGATSETEAVDLESHLAWCRDCIEAASRLNPTDTLVDTVRSGAPSIRIVPEEPDAELMEALCRLSVQHVTPADLAGVKETPRPADASRSQAPLDTSSTSAATDEIHDFLAPAQARDEIGRLGSYRVLKVQGSGGMGVVFLAEHSHLRRPVALKVLLATRYTDPHYLARFRREAEALAHLRHPNIVQIHEVGEHRGRPYFVLEYIGGGNLAEWLRGESRPAGIRASAELVTTLARAMHYAHRQGVVHRDLKPGNVLLEKVESRGLRVESQSDQTSDPNSPTLNPQLSTLNPKISESHPDRTEWQDALAQSYQNLGAMHYLTGRDPKDFYEKGLAIRLRLIRDHPDNPRYAAAAAGGYVNLGLCYQWDRQPEKAAEVYRNAQALLEPLIREHPEEPRYASLLASALVNWAMFLKDTGQSDAALNRYTQAIEVAEAILRNEPHYVTARLDLHSAYGGRAQAYSVLKRYDEAVADWDRVLELSDEASRPGYRLSRAVVLMLAGNHGQAAEESGGAGARVARFGRHAVQLGLPVRPQN